MNTLESRLSLAPTLHEKLGKGPDEWTLSSTDIANIIAEPEIFTRDESTWALSRAIDAVMHQAKEFRRQLLAECAHNDKAMLTELALQE